MEKSASMSETSSQLIDLPTAEQATIETSFQVKERVSKLISFCLKKDITKIRKERIDDYKQICMREFTSFHEKYPTLFFSIVENPSAFPLYRLDEMLALKANIEKKNTDEEKASIHLGQKYYNEFVKDTVSKLDNDLDKNKNI